MEEPILIYTLNYSVISYINDRDENTFCVPIDIQLHAMVVGETETTHEHIGSMSAFRIRLWLAMEQGYDGMDIFDAEEETLHIGKAIYDEKEEDFKKVIYNFFPDMNQREDVLILAYTYLVPEYQEKGIASRAIKDLYNTFIDGCSLFVVQSNPLKAGFGSFEKTSIEMVGSRSSLTNPEGGRKSIKEFYQSLGFQNIPGIDKDILFISPYALPVAFEAILFDLE